MKPISLGTSGKTSLLEHLRLIYITPQMFSMVILGFCSGLPFLLTLSTLNLWLVESGISKVTVGLLGLLHLPYSLKFVYAPFMDAVRIPWFYKRLGHRRSWALASQMCLMMFIACLACCDPQEHLPAILVLAFLISCAKASQDVVLYTCQIEILSKEQYTAGATCVIVGYRLGMLISGAGAIYLAAQYGWQVAYLIMAALVGTGVVYILSIAEPKPLHSHINPLTHLEHVGFHPRASLAHQTFQALCIPFRLLKKYPYRVSLLAFLVWFKIGDSLSHFMANAYYLELGYSKIEIGRVVKTFGMCASLLGGVTAAVLERMYGMRTALVIAGGSHMLSIFLMIVLGWVGYHMPTFYATMALEHSTNGMAMSLFIAYLYQLSPQPYAAILYPFLWAVHSVGRDLSNTLSGWLAEMLGWYPFFTLCALISMPSLWIFWRIYNPTKDPSLYLGIEPKP